MLISSYSSAQVTDEQIKDFFAGNPTPEQIADQAAALGMNQSQISEAMGIANYGGNTKAERDSAINAWVGNKNNGFVWSQSGALTQGNGVAGDIAAARAAARGNTSRGVVPAWAKGSQQICPDGMGLGVNSAGSPKCFGSPTASFPQGEAPINPSAAQSTLSSGVGRMFSDPKLNDPKLAGGNVSAQEYQRPTNVGQYGPSGHDVWSPVENRWIGTDEVAAFIGTNPSDRQIFSQAARLGLTLLDLNTALYGQGYTGQALGQHYSMLEANAFTGGLGYSALDVNGASSGRIVVGGGHHSVDTADGGSYWAKGAGGPAFGFDNGIEGPNYNGTSNWSVKDGYIGRGTGVAGDGFGVSRNALVGGGGYASPANAGTGSGGSFPGGWSTPDGWKAVGLEPSPWKAEVGGPYISQTKPLLVGPAPLGGEPYISQTKPLLVGTGGGDPYQPPKPPIMDADHQTFPNANFGTAK